jgi:fumarylacetoacetase
MTSAIDKTHDPKRQSWVGSANGHPDFPLQNLPLGVFSPPGNNVPDARARGGIAIGDKIFDIKAALAAGLFSGEAEIAAKAAAVGTLNSLVALGAGPRRALRRRVFDLLASDGKEASQARGLGGSILHDANVCAMHLPAKVASFTDFFAGIHHATNGGRRRNPNDPLGPNYKYVPVAYHSRASSLQPSGLPIRRPSGQRKLPDEAAPSYGPCRKLDYELELAVWLGPGNKQGEPIPIAEATTTSSGSASSTTGRRATSSNGNRRRSGRFSARVSVRPSRRGSSRWRRWRRSASRSRRARPVTRNRLPYLWDEADQQNGAFDIAIEALILTEKMRGTGQEPHRMSRSNTLDLYWTVAQMVAHQTCNGCNIEPGDFSALAQSRARLPKAGAASANFRTMASARIRCIRARPAPFSRTVTRSIFCARASREGYVSIGFGECRGRV